MPDCEFVACPYLGNGLLLLILLLLQGYCSADSRPLLFVVVVVVMPLPLPLPLAPPFVDVTGDPPPTCSLGTDVALGVGDDWCCTEPAALSKLPAGDEDEGCAPFVSRFLKSFISSEGRDETRARDESR